MTRPLTIDEASEKVHRSRRLVEQWLKDGMPSQLVLGKRYIRQADLVEWAAKHGRRRGRRLPDE